MIFIAKIKMEQKHCAACPVRVAEMGTNECALLNDHYPTLAAMMEDCPLEEEQSGCGGNCTCGDE